MSKYRKIVQDLKQTCTPMIQKDVRTYMQNHVTGIFIKSLYQLAKQYGQEE